MATTVKITETYDMKTTKGKIGLVGVHTPTNTLLRKLYPGLMKNHRFVRFVKCDVVGAVAQSLPADPLQVGVGAGQIAPEDMFNPILYTAVTNSSFDTICARVRNLTDIATLNSVSQGEFVSGEDANFNAYYALLSENGKYRKAMPQSGFMIKSLVPLAHTVISTFGNVGSIGNTTALADDGETPVYVPDMEIPDLGQDFANASGAEIFYRGKAIKMPRIPLHTTKETIADIPNPNIPKTNVLALILPPCKLNEFYYRMRVTWTVRFEQVCSSLEAGGYGVYVNDIGPYAHASNYTFDNAKAMPVEMDSVSAENVEIEKIMES